MDREMFEEIDWADDIGSAYVVWNFAVMRIADFITFFFWA